MIRLFLIFLISLSITLFGLLNAEGNPTIPSMDQLVKAPQIIEHQQKPHAVFDYGGLKISVCCIQEAHTISSMQCGAINR